MLLAWLAGSLCEVRRESARRICRPLILKKRFEGMELRESWEKGWWLESKILKFQIPAADKIWGVRSGCKG